jgi:hypothetical protein
MDDPFSTAPQRPSRPPKITDFVRISKKTFIALLNELPFQELHLQSRYITDEEDASATVSFVQELGRALGNVRIIPSASKTPSPKKLLTGTVDRRNPTPTLPSEEEDTPTEPRHRPDLPPSTTATRSIPSQQTSQIVTPRRFPTSEGKSVTWKRRQEIMKLAIL